MNLRTAKFWVQVILEVKIVIDWKGILSHYIVCLRSLRSFYEGRSSGSKAFLEWKTGPLLGVYSVQRRSIIRKCLPLTPA